MSALEDLVVSADGVRAAAALVDLELSPERAAAAAVHLASLLEGANALSRFVDDRPQLPLFRAPR